jgi:hypothetical protein
MPPIPKEDVVIVRMLENEEVFRRKISSPHFERRCFKFAGWRCMKLLFFDHAWSNGFRLVLFYCLLQFGTNCTVCRYKISWQTSQTGKPDRQTRRQARQSRTALKPVGLKRSAVRHLSDPPRNTCALSPWITDRQLSCSKSWLTVTVGQEEISRFLSSAWSRNSYF